MKWKNKVPAFTLIEMLVVMVLSGLVSGAIYFAYFTIYSYHEKLSLNLERFANVREMTGLLQKDIEQCRLMNTVGIDQIELTMTEGKVFYRFFADKIIREQGSRSDEYKGVFEMPEFYYQAIRVSVGNKRIDEVILKSNADQPVHDWVLYKAYDLASIIYSDSLNLAQ